MLAVNELGHKYVRKNCVHYEHAHEIYAKAGGNNIKWEELSDCCNSKED